MPDYRKGNPWKGLDRYECSHCPFDSLDEQTIRTHVVARHKTVKPSILGPEGEPINTEVEVVAEAEVTEQEEEESDG